jgi:hypothetical protein
MRPFLLFAFAVLSAAGVTRAASPEPVARPEPQRFASGPARVSLIELYSSEGCSSCPPAERWLGELRSDPGLWKTFVPVAFHVDYWNRLGWPDRFSSREFTQRQYAYAAGWSEGSVYTPCFVRDGAEWHTHGPVGVSGGAAGVLTATYDGATVWTEFTPAAGPNAPDSRGYEVHAAILGAGIVSKVTAGENSGETLRHEFIALALGGAPLGRELPLAVPKVAGVPRHALAVWITRRGELAPVQAAGGWLD